MTYHVITIFPESFDSYLKESILGRAIRDKKIAVKFYNPMDFCEPKKRVDDRPYGGGPGMVLRPELFLKAFSKIKTKKAGKVKVILFSPSGKKFDTAYAKKTVKQKYTDVILISGRYEGIDARVKKVIKDMGGSLRAKFSSTPGVKDAPTPGVSRILASSRRQNNFLSIDDISIGDYVLTSGDLPAMVLIDSISRQISGVLGKYESLEEERISSSEVYTRPEVLRITESMKTQKHKSIKTKKQKNIKEYRVPKVLLSGDHAKIEEWKMRHRKHKSTESTKAQKNN
ncbi:MAG: tRNA (Guanine-N1-)-methyltransferase [Candidatus Nomurabacteria bacterium GW2011_GWB1_37_5]|uniref:tRNA (guanine-N(1)-)-methyltransferase n=1 Tax=Candidatus Nomurabacteria bacterium GW2011_GWB1_37_5 TaxID=1618742 RepID=A0A0G0JGQ6_9BACT|nr:MAG: tRNA (Guanine-N1-)-methyltransferase [Candidatus Nomurabacteria bacterium GW2011_GWB1_37_5]